jgi:hypothetical protein
MCSPRCAALDVQPWRVDKRTSYVLRCRRFANGDRDVAYCDGPVHGGARECDLRSLRPGQLELSRSLEQIGAMRQRCQRIVGDNAYVAPRKAPCVHDRRARD